MSQVRSGHWRVRGEESRRGATMVMAIFMMSTAAMLSYALIATVKSSRQEERGSREELRALYICEAGVGRAIADLNNGGDGKIGSEDAPVEFGSASYYVTAANMGPGLVSLVATGTESRAQSRVQVVVQNTPDNLFRYAAFGDKVMAMDSWAKVDSYDSSLGAYEDQDVNGTAADPYAKKNGDVGSNKDVVLSANAWVHGDATPGPTGTTVIMGTTAGVDGSTLPSTSEQDLPPIDVPTYPSLGSMNWTSTTGSIGPGELAYTDFKVASSKTMTIVGPAKVVVDNFSLAASANIVIDATNGPVEFFVMNDFVVNSNTTFGSLTKTPADLAINLLSDNIINPDVTVDLDNVTFDSNARIYGTIYAPQAHIEIDSNFELFGALVGRSVLLSANSRLHYDEALATAAVGGEGASYQALCWLTLPKN